MKDEELIAKALEARKKAYCPYSEFPVGAALEGGSGRVFAGANVENGVNDLSICAERVALFKGVSEGEREFRKIAVVCAGDFCSPCGACRQTLFEHAPHLRVLMAKPNGDYRTVKLSKLLPEAFEL